MSINSLPNEVLYQILEETVELQKKDGVLFTYGLSKLPECRDKNVSTKLNRYIRGPIPDYQLKWDAAVTLRLVCKKWHTWLLAYAVSDVYVKIWRGSERWFDLTTQRDKYKLYEMIDYPKGEACHRDPYGTLKNTRKFLERVPEAAAKVRRLWFNGLYIPETDEQIISILRFCKNLRITTIPWTILRTGSPRDWASILEAKNDLPLKSLELHMIEPKAIEKEQILSATQQSPLLSKLVDFSSLTRLKLIGSTSVLPITDADLIAMARTATNIQDFQLTCTSSVTIEGVMAIVRASRTSLRLLEHSPRADHGFWHPDPGHLSDGAHICELLAGCPRLQDVSVSLPSMCGALFANNNLRVRWRGDCQVRALRLCGAPDRRSPEAQAELREVLRQARKLIKTRAVGVLPATLTLELFYAGMIFDPHVKAVHGDFGEGEILSGGSWPSKKQKSGKGPYGSTGLYGKMEEDTPFHIIDESDLFAGLALNLIRV